MDVTPRGTENGEVSDDADVAIVEIDELPDRTTKRRAARTPKRRTATAGSRRRSAARQEAIAPDLYLHRLISRAELGQRGVAPVETPLGRLAVGIANGKPFAVSDTCRHLFASLGEGRITREGCLQCPWHRSRYDVTSGKMVRGPQGLLYLSVRELVRAYTNLVFPLRVFPVIEREGVLYLETAALEA